MCDCINKMTNQLREHTGDPDAIIITETAFLKGKDDDFYTISFTPVYGRFREKKKDGTLKPKPSKVPLSVAFCPFCGERYVKSLEQEK